MTACETEQTMEQLPSAGLSELATTALDNNNIQASPHQDGGVMREIEVNRGMGGWRKLTEHVSPDGTKTFSFSHRIVYMTPPDEGEETITWKEGSSKIESLFRGNETGPHPWQGDDPTIVSKFEMYLENAFPAPKVEIPKHPNRFKRFLGRLGIG